MDHHTRGLVWDRAGGLCEVSGRALGERDGNRWECHHRRNKGMGGTSRGNTDWLSNLLALHPDVHNGGPRSVHGRRAWSQERGYLVPKHHDHPGQWPVWLRGRHWVLLGEHGGYHPLPPGLVLPEPEGAPDDPWRRA